MRRYGLLLCAKYAVSPNILGYCGPGDFLNIVDHLKEGLADEELNFLLSHFETLFPYLNLIAKANKVDEPFHWRAVEAYWLGNSWLRKVKETDLIFHFRENLSLDKKLAKVDFQKLVKKSLRQTFLPHHSFHVLNVFRMARLELDSYKIEAIDNCRIGWGKIEKILKIKNKIHSQKTNKIVVRTSQLELRNDALVLDKPVKREIKVDYQGKELIKNLKIGDWVSFHWGLFCDVLTDRQVKNLEFYTQKAIDFYNFSHSASASGRLSSGRV